MRASLASRPLPLLLPALLALLLVPATAGADPSFMTEPTLQGFAGKKPFHLPDSQCGILHLTAADWVGGGNLKPRIGSTLTKTGAPTIVTPTNPNNSPSIYKTALSFGTGNYFTLASDPTWNGNGQTHTCITFYANGTTSSEVMLATGANNGSGWYSQFNADRGTAVFNATGTSVALQDPAGANPVTYIGYTTGPNVQCWVRDASNNVYFAENLQPVQTALAAPTSSGTHLVLGAYDNFGLPFIHGSVAEICVGAGAGDGTTIAALEAQALPGLHTIAMAALGDSLTFGVGSSTAPYPLRVQQGAGYKVTVANYGVSGDATSSILTRWTSTVRATHPSTLFVLGGTNDILSSISTSTTLSNLTTIWDQAISDGDRVVAITVPPGDGNASWTVAMNTALDNLNSGIRSAAASRGIAVYDLYAAVRDTVDPYKLKLTYDSGDGIHLNQTGYDLFANGARVTAGY